MARAETGVPPVAVTAGPTTLARLAVLTTSVQTSAASVVRKLLFPLYIGSVP